MMAVLNSIGIILMIIIQLVVVGVHCDSESDDQLIFANILFRHGDRNIAYAYPNDPWKDETHWKEGYGQLTDIGKQQQYDLGTYLRNRYFSLIPNNGSYRSKSIYVESTDVDRTLMSAAYAMAGMFPVQNAQSQNGSGLWQAVPIHSVPFSKPCHAYDEAAEEYASSELGPILKSNLSLIDYLETHTGQKFLNHKQIRLIHDTLKVEQLKNFTLPPWTKEVFYPGSDLEKLAKLSFKSQADTKHLARLKVGFLLREMFEHFTMKINSTLSPDRSLWIYSYHDSTIINILNALGLLTSENFLFPNYSSCLFFELHKSSDDFHVELFFKQHRGEDIEPLEPLVIPNCGQKCPLSKMLEIYRHILPTEDFDTECHNNKATNCDLNHAIENHL